VDGGGAERWSAVADDWANSWGSFASPVWPPLLEAAGVGPGTRVLDVGCGTGELLAHLTGLGVVATGVDPAPGMAARARRTAPEADVHVAGFEDLPFAGASFDVVVTVNSLQFADDVREALGELERVLVPGGAVAVANWAEGSRNDLDVVERAVAAAHDDEVPPDGDYRLPGGLESWLAEAGLELVTAGLVQVPWVAADDDALVRGVLFGEDAETMAELAPVVVGAAEPFRTADGGYRLVNAFRFAVATSP
jgi:SAM-dependent methyltransferase